MSQIRVIYGFTGLSVLSSSCPAGSSMFALTTEDIVLSKYALKNPPLTYKVFSVLGCHRFGNWRWCHKLEFTTLTGPLIVPVPRRSPGLKLQPLIVWCASCWVKVQYLYHKERNQQAENNIPILSTKICFLQISKLSAKRCKVEEFTTSV